MRICKSIEMSYKSAFYKCSHSKAYHICKVYGKTVIDTHKKDYLLLILRFSLDYSELLMQYDGLRCFERNEKAFFKDKAGSEQAPIIRFD